MEKEKNTLQSRECWELSMSLKNLKKKKKGPEDVSVPMVLDSEDDSPVITQGVQDVASQMCHTPLEPLGERDRHCPPV